jgi:glycosyltransferase involved in cell wall biosynthesis
MQMGTGLQNKLLEAMAMGIPCITSALAASAFKGNGEAIRIGHTAASFAQEAVTLLTDDAAAKKQADKGRQFVHKYYRWDTVLRKFDDICRL